MDCQTYRASSLPHIWAVETLACSNQIDVSLLLALLEKTPEISNDIGRNARELVSLKILENIFIQGAQANPISPFRETISLDPSDRCEDVLRRIISKISPQHLKSAVLEVPKWDLEPFIEHKRSNLPKYSLKQLKDAILTGSHSILASLREKSGLRIGNAECKDPVKDGNCNGITPRVAGSDTNDGSVLPRDLPDQNLVRGTRKRRATSETAAEELCTTHSDSVKKCKHDISGTEQDLAGNLISSVVDRVVADKSTVSVQHIQSTSFVLQRKSHVGSMEQNEPFKEDNNGLTSSNGLVGPDEVLPGKKQAAHCVTELGDKSEEQGQNQNVEAAKNDKKGFSDLKRANNGNSDDRTGIARMENASFGPQFTKNQDSSTETCRDQSLLAGTSKIYSGDERCIMEKTTHVEVIGESGHSGDGNNLCTSKGLVGNDEVPHEKQVPHRGAEVSEDNSHLEIPNSKSENAENVHKSFDGLMTMNVGMNKIDQEILRIVPTVGEAENVDKSNDIDGYEDERNNIDTQKKIFLSSQCTYSQDSLATSDLRELPLCMKCNKGGELLSCSSDSCPLVIHESCMGSDSSFDTREKFYCPFCAYSRAISKYMEVKEKVSLSRKELTTFIRLEPQLESKEHSGKSFGIEGNHLQHTNDLPKSNELNQRDGVEKASNHQRRKNLEFEKAAGPSELRSDYSPPFGPKTVGTTKRLDQSLDEENQDGKSIRQVSKSTRVKGRKQIAALKIRNCRDETTSTQVFETSGSKKHADLRSKKGLLSPSETDLPSKQKCSGSAQSSDAIESSESSDAAKYFIRVRKQVRQNLWPTIPQMRRVRIPWTSREEDKLKEGMRLYCGPHDIIIPWTQILEHGVGVFQPSRTTVDLKDKWRNMCKASPKAR